MSNAATMGKQEVSSSRLSIPLSYQAAALPSWSLPTHLVKDILRHCKHLIHPPVLPRVHLLTVEIAVNASFCYLRLPCQSRQAP
ncbi:hypothetical protein MLD38_009549 [Melastoma candidum]|uniref:Uncharacterized protein n=1 Tax=Melastoma candidum TaxID=119954 RepID=A0ACB9RXB6_9MYRT|nr:hypothetical protein MLD38_009549 [Melastoma candidum]